MAVGPWVHIWLEMYSTGGASESDSRNKSVQQYNIKSLAVYLSNWNEKIHSKLTLQQKCIFFKKQWRNQDFGLIIIDNYKL